MFGKRHKNNDSENGLKLTYDPVRFVMLYGKPYHILRMSRFVKALNIDTAGLLTDLKESQNEDGGWPWLWKEGKPSGMAETGRAVELLIQFGEEKTSAPIKKAFEFISSLQRNDGGWSENKQLLLIIPRKWYWTSCRHSCTWITAIVIRGLIAAGYMNNIYVVKGLEFLEKAQNNDGGWPSHTGPDYPFDSDLASMDDILNTLLTAGTDRKAEIVLNLEKCTFALRNQWRILNFSGSVLAILFTLGYSSKSEHVKDLIQILHDSQKIDGGWSGQKIAPSDPWHTTYYLEYLDKYGIKYKTEF